MRAIGSSATGSVYSNSDVKQKADEDKNTLMGLIPSMVADGKIKDIVGLCKAADDLGIGDFTAAVLEEFDKPPSGKETRYASRKGAFEQQMKGD